MKSLLLAATLLLAFVPFASAQDWAKARLENSPRHREYVKVKHGDREVECFVVYPEVRDKATAVVLVHEIFGLSDWIKSAADQLAEAGYIAIAPDLLSGAGPKGGGTPEFNSDTVTRAVRDLPADQVTADLNAAVDYVAKLPSCNGKVAVAGFCWGGGQSFRYATNNPEIKAAFVFYGSGPTEPAEIAKIKCPVYGFYGEMDNRVNATLDQSKELMKAAGKTFEPVIYEGAGHGFLRMGEDPAGNEPNKKGREAAWNRWKEILANIE